MKEGSCLWIWQTRGVRGERGGSLKGVAWDCWLRVEWSNNTFSPKYVLSCELTSNELEEPQLAIAESEGQSEHDHRYWSWGKFGLSKRYFRHGWMQVRIDGGSTDAFTCLEQTVKWQKGCGGHLVQWRKNQGLKPKSRKEVASNRAAETTGSSEGNTEATKAEGLLVRQTNLVIVTCLRELELQGIQRPGPSPGHPT